MKRIITIREWRRKNTKLTSDNIHEWTAQLQEMGLYPNVMSDDYWIRTYRGWTSEEAFISFNTSRKVPARKVTT